MIPVNVFGRIIEMEFSYNKLYWVLIFLFFFHIIKVALRIGMENPR